MAYEHIIYTDESAANGKYYSDFYGGALVGSQYLETSISLLNNRKLQLNLFNEIKWQKVTANYLDKYKEMMNLLFDLVQQDKIKIRIMFTQNCHVPIGLTREQREQRYFVLYYQFIKHAFGLQYAAIDHGPASLRLNMDQLPDNKERIAQFKGYIHGLERNSQFNRAGIRVPIDQIAEVRSHDHVILQCLDVVLGAIQFRLNDQHKVKPVGSRRRGKRTIAKEKLYKHINALIREIYPGFNIGISTGTGGNAANRWLHPYRHWLFIPKSKEYDARLTKSKR